MHIATVSLFLCSIMSVPPTPHWPAEELELPEIQDSDDLGELVRKLSLCVAPYGCPTLCCDEDATEGSTFAIHLCIGPANAE